MAWNNITTQRKLKASWNRGMHLTVYKVWNFSWFIWKFIQQLTHKMTKHSKFRFMHTAQGALRWPDAEAASTRQRWDDVESRSNINVKYLHFGVQLTSQWHGVCVCVWCDHKQAKSVKFYPGGRKMDLISSISAILSRMWFHCVQSPSAIIWAYSHVSSTISHRICFFEHVINNMLKQAKSRRNQFRNVSVGS